MTAPTRAALLAVFATCALGLTTTVARADNAAAATAGEAKAAVCTACHGVNGNSVNPEWPNLAGQGTAYISEQLKLFRAGHRNNMVMYPMAVALTDDDIRDLAAYFSRQTPVGLEADPATVKAGEALYRGGDRARGIPACLSCHGPRGLGMTTAGYPKLRGQHATYTIKQLNDYAAEQRYVDVTSGAKTKSRNGHMMTTIAKRLSADDMAALASYIQGLR
ncbi:MAG: cytochrome c4 [Gammaproteobacteria bacterium]|nr:cytochrome c4 [Gammaproteobacteria bacterium]